MICNETDTRKQKKRKEERKNDETPCCGICETIQYYYQSDRWNRARSHPPLRPPSPLPLCIFADRKGGRGTGAEKRDDGESYTRPLSSDRSLLIRVAKASDKKESFEGHRSKLYDIIWNIISFCIIFRFLKKLFDN